MRSFLTIITAIAICLGTSLAQAADKPLRPAPHVDVAPAPAPQRAQCVAGTKCDVYKTTRQHGLVQTNIDLVCIPIKQAKPGIVVIRFYDAAGRELDAGNNQHSNQKGMVDQFCVGRHYLEKAQAGHIEVCNDVDTKKLAPQQIAILLESGMPLNHWLYLYAGRFH